MLACQDWFAFVVLRVHPSQTRNTLSLSSGSRNDSGSGLTSAVGIDPKRGAGCPRPFGRFANADLRHSPDNGAHFTPIFARRQRRPRPRLMPIHLPVYAPRHDRMDGARMSARDLITNYAATGRLTSGSSIYPAFSLLPWEPVPGRLIALGSTMMAWGPACSSSGAGPAITFIGLYPVAGVARRPDWHLREQSLHHASICGGRRDRCLSTGLIVHLSADLLGAGGSAG